jgi:hypothetical protein
MCPNEQFYHHLLWPFYFILYLKFDTSFQLFSFYRGWLKGFYVSFDLFGVFQVEEMQGLWLSVMPF